MNYEIVTFRWRCPECQSPVRLKFTKAGSTEEEASDEFVCDQVFCVNLHFISDELAEEIIQAADEEFYKALEQGQMVAQVWQAPEISEEQREL